MRESRVFLIFLGTIFILLMGVSSLLFNLQEPLFRAEIVFFVFFFLFACYLLISLHLKKRFACNYLFIFFTLNAVNILYLYFSGLAFKEIALPIVMSLIGLYLSVYKLK